MCGLNTSWRSSFLLLLSCACLSFAASARVSYRPADGNRPPMISIKGELVEADLQAFNAIAETAQQDAAAFIARRGGTVSTDVSPVNVVLDSRGGSIWVAMSMGRVIRSHGFVTRVELGARCVSACVFVLAAGQGRYVGGRVGIHRPFLPNDGVTSARAKKAQYEGINAQTRQYLEEMGLPPSLHARMMQTPPDSVTWLTGLEVSSYGLAKMASPPPRPATP